MMHPRVYTDIQLILHFSPIKSAFPQTSESSVSAVTVEAAQVCPEPQPWLFTFSYKQHSWGSSWWPLPGWLMTYTLPCVGGSGPTHQQLGELHQLVVYGGTRGSAISLPSMETLASCQPHFMAFYPPLDYSSVTMFPQSSWELRVYFLDQTLFWGNLHKVGEHFPDHRQEAILPSLSSSVSLTQECVSKKGQDTVIQMVSRTESEGKPEALIWTAGFVFCLCFNSEPAGGGRARGTGWESVHSYFNIQQWVTRLEAQLHFQGGLGGASRRTQRPLAALTPGSVLAASYTVYPVSFNLTQGLP